MIGRGVLAVSSAAECVAAFRSCLLNEFEQRSPGVRLQTEQSRNLTPDAAKNAAKKAKLAPCGAGAGCSFASQQHTRPGQWCCRIPVRWLSSAALTLKLIHISEAHKAAVGV